jgi:hypothetical protein
MMNDYHADAPPRNNGRDLASFIFAIFRQIHADPETTANEFRLAYAISQLLNKKTRVCFPLQSTLAEQLGVTDRAVRQYITGLVERGHLRVRHRGRDKSSIYELVLKDRNAASGHDDIRPERTFRSSHDDDRKPDVVRPEVSRRMTGTVLPTEPTSEPTSEPAKERGAPKARPRKAPSVRKESSDLGTGGVALAPPPRHREPWGYGDGSDLPF